jgi:hypothetical protein
MSPGYHTPRKNRAPCRVSLSRGFPDNICPSRIILGLAAGQRPLPHSGSSRPAGLLPLIFSIHTAGLRAKFIRLWRRNRPGTYIPPCATRSSCREFMNKEAQRKQNFGFWNEAGFIEWAPLKSVNASFVQNLSHFPHKLSR